VGWNAPLSRGDCSTVIRDVHLRRYAEIGAKLRSLDQELDDWSKLTDQEALGMRRHHSQVRLLKATLQGLLEPVAAAVKAAAADASVLDQGVSWENEILAAHSIWEVFRAKLLLRTSEMFRTHLAACDDLAWACYQPALQAFAPGATKTPPLVFLSATWSPFAQARDGNFQNEVRAYGRAGAVLSDDEFQKVLKYLPIPLVSLPWYQLSHLPGAILIAHEVGHVVERDFDLTGDIAAALQAANLQFTSIWQGWAREVFADLYGCLAMGPAYVGALMDLLATSVTVIKTEQLRGGEYPTRALRVELALRALHATGHGDASDALRASWAATYPPPHAMEDFIPDVDKVVAAIYGGPVRGQPLTKVISWHATQVEVTKMKDAVLRNFDLSKYGDVRQAFAAARLIHEDPGNSDLQTVFQRLIKHITGKGGQAYRYRGTTVGTRPQLDQQLENDEPAARDQGRALRKLLS